MSIYVSPLLETSRDPRLLPMLRREAWFPKAHCNGSMHPGIWRKVPLYDCRPRESLPQGPRRKCIGITMEQVSKSPRKVAIAEYNKPCTGLDLERPPSIRKEVIAARRGEYDVSSEEIQPSSTVISSDYPEDSTQGVQPWWPTLSRSTISPSLLCT